MILNLTQHRATPEQIAEFVVDFPEDDRADLVRLLTLPAAELAANPHAALAFVEARVQMIMDELIMPHLRHNAQAMLMEGGFVTSPVEAYNMLRPEVSAKGIGAMIGGAPYLMAPLERALKAVGVQVCYALSDRVSIEQPQPDGSVTKTSVFKHVGFLWV